MLQGWGGVVGGFIVFVSVLLSPVCGPTGSPQLGVGGVSYGHWNIVRYCAESECSGPNIGCKYFP